MSYKNCIMMLHGNNIWDNAQFLKVGGLEIRVA